MLQEKDQGQVFYLLISSGASPRSMPKFVLHPLIHTLLGFTLAQDIENALHKVYAVGNEGEGEGKKIPHSRMLRERGSKRRHEEKASL